MKATIDSDVVIVGAGPVGLTLAMDLASRGVNVTVAELRRASEPPSVKCNSISARSMEIFRRLGVAAKLRGAGLPADYPNDIASRTTATGIELCRIGIPSRGRALQRNRGAGHVVAHSGASASDQSDLFRAHPVRARRGPTTHPHPQPHCIRGLHPRRQRPQSLGGYAEPSGGFGRIQKLGGRAHEPPRCSLTAVHIGAAPGTGSIGGSRI